ncbi:hypothetical protein GIW81_10305 [Hyphomicrobium sp. xq]|uniref:Uncharacterized protein n=1 Tax=Hyphomicrobium album TaxID=2665159 RepID=A0A6I3KLT3_9HYPH|nr:hypothetical protein [Hyphomicrobium album]MTD94722.1 hypothetical protein [Hyphomicrobium album]
MIANILNSTFVTSLLGAGAGAWAGAYFAQRIVERGARRERLRDEVRHANSAIALALFIANTSLSLKAQHVRGMAQGYVRLRNEFGAFEDRQRSGLNPPNAEFHVPMELNTLEELVLPLDRLQLVASEKLSLPTRPSATVFTLIANAHSLNGSIRERNKCIEEFRTTAPHTHQERVQWYFAHPDGEGSVDARYASFMEAIPQQLDNCIFYSKLFIEDVAVHGERYRAALKKEFGITAPRMTTPSFAAAEAGGLMPRAEGYTEWLGMFVPLPDERLKRSRWGRRLRIAGRRLWRKVRNLSCCAL